MALLAGLSFHFAPVVAARGRLIVRLLEGDPVAWTILGGVVVVMGGWAAYKKYAGKS